MKIEVTFIIILAGLLLVGCVSSSCPPETVTYMSEPFPTGIDGNAAGPQLVKIKGKEVLVDEFISGPVCNDTWSGSVYLTCDIQVPAWEEDPFFWQDCELEIEEGTIVYVEAHKDKSYTDGCSCHE